MPGEKIVTIPVHWSANTGPGPRRRYPIIPANSGGDNTPRAIRLADRMGLEYVRDGEIYYAGQTLSVPYGEAAQLVGQNFAEYI